MLLINSFLVFFLGQIFAEVVFFGPDQALQFVVLLFFLFLVDNHVDAYHCRIIIWIVLTILGIIISNIPITSMCNYVESFYRSILRNHIINMNIRIVILLVLAFVSLFVCLLVCLYWYLHLSTFKNPSHHTMF